VAESHEPLDVALGRLRPAVPRPDADDSLAGLGRQQRECHIETDAVIVVQVLVLAQVPPRCVLRGAARGVDVAAPYDAEAG